MDAAPAAAPGTPATPPVDPAAVVAEAAKGTPDAGATPSADDVMKERLAKIATDREALTKDQDTHKERLSKADRFEKFEELRAKGDYIGALEAAGADVDDFYVKATDQINAREAARKDPVKAAREEIQAHETKKQEQERLSTEKTWKNAAHAELGKARDAYPEVAWAIASGKISMDDVMKVAYAESANGRDSGPGAVLKLVQDKLRPADASPAEKKPAAESGAPPSASGSHVPVGKPADEEDLSIDDAYERAKRKHFK